MIASQYLRTGTNYAGESGALVFGYPLTTPPMLAPVTIDVSAYQITVTLETALKANYATNDLTPSQPTNVISQFGANEPTSPTLQVSVIGSQDP